MDSFDQDRSWEKQSYFESISLHPSWLHRIGEWEELRFLKASNSSSIQYYLRNWAAQGEHRVKASSGPAEEFATSEQQPIEQDHSLQDSGQQAFAWQWNALLLEVP